VVVEVVLGSHRVEVLPFSIGILEQELVLLILVQEEAVANGDTQAVMALLL
jgi:hypothetical protein